MRALVLLPLAFIATATAAADGLTRSQRTEQRLLAGKVPGPPQDSINRYESREMTVVDGAVLFRVSRDLVYRNDMGGCAQLNDDSYLQTNLYGTDRLSRGDIAQIIDRTGNFGRGACPFGDFVPYRTPR